MRGQPLKLPGIFKAKRNNELLTKILSFTVTVQAGTPMTVPREAKVSFWGMS
jgi:hypothetical protein